MEQINFDLTKFHGDSYIESLDKVRLTGQIKRLFDVLKSGKIYPCDELSRLANVAEGSVPKRASDLRIYHGFIIEAKRINDSGLHSYQLIGREKVKAKPKKLKPIGNEALWKEMWHCIKVYGAAPTQSNNSRLSGAACAWAMALAADKADLEYDIEI